MNQWVKTVYLHLPPVFRSWAATARGFYLRSWRYGPETDRLVEQALGREHWTPEHWKRWREERLAHVLRRAATRVPFYREQWAKRRAEGDQSSWELLENWPILEKQTLRKHAAEFVADDCDPRKMFLDNTSGTTGTPLQIYLRRATVRAWYALHEARVRCWHGISRHDRWAILGGQMVTPASQQKPPFWVWNRGMNQLYLSTFHLTAANAAGYVEALRKYKIRYLIGYTSALDLLARYVLRMGITDLNMAVVVTNAEPVYPHQRQAIAEAFHCPVRETYGMAEIASAASECREGSLHQWPEAGWTEVIENGKPVPPGQAGDLVCTGLFNDDMPLIRYRVGDRGRLSDPDTRCRCGRSLPLLLGLEGRRNDQLITRDGRRVFWLNPTFYGLPVEEAQIVQESRERLRVIFTPGPGFSEQDEAAIRSRLIHEVGPMEVVLEPVAQVPREPNGKFRAIVCRIPESEIEELDRREFSSRS